jgi:acyl-ACP thioesterase
MEATPVYQKQYHVEPEDVGLDQRTKLSALFGYFQDIASLHAANLGVGIEKLAPLGLSWALIRMRVEVVRYPGAGETLLIETWYPEPKKFEFERDFAVCDVNGNTIAKAMSSWIVFDVKTRELRKSGLISPEFPLSTRGRALEGKFVKLKAFGPLELVAKKEIREEDADRNGHLNNAKYIDFIMDCLTMEEQKRYQVKQIEINYNNEALPGDEILFYKDISALSSNLIYFEGNHEIDRKSIFKAQLEITV